MNSSMLPPLVSIVGRSGSGKTTLMEGLIQEFRKMGLHIGTIKHHHRDLEMDSPGKDTWRHRKAGSETTIIACPNRIGVIMDTDHDLIPTELIPYFPGKDIVLAEGYKYGNQPKVEIFRAEVHGEPVCLHDDSLIALVSDSSVNLGVPRFTTHDIPSLAEFLIEHFKLKRK
jgi:molybdopterin-guanine dinucleotide biosynthesis protein B